MKCSECNSTNIFELVKQHINTKEIIGKMYKEIYWCIDCQDDDHKFVETWITKRKEEEE